MDAETSKRVSELIEAEEGAMNRLPGLLGHVAVGIALVMSLFHLWAAWDIVPTTTLRFAHVGFTLVLGFMLFPVAGASATASRPGTGRWSRPASTSPGT
jgi:TRAP-type uncharacterized transport system fused permease subunit